MLKRAPAGLTVGHLKLGELHPAEEASGADSSDPCRVLDIALRQ
jgi:hypothetical protein